MGVAVDEAGHHHAAFGIDFAGAAGFRKFLDAARGTGVQDDAVLHQHDAVRDDAEVTQCRSTAGSGVTAQSQ